MARIGWGWPLGAYAEVFCVNGATDTAAALAWSRHGKGKDALDLHMLQYFLDERASAVTRPARYARITVFLTTLGL